MSLWSKIAPGNPIALIYEACRSGPAVTMHRPADDWWPLRRTIRTGPGRVIDTSLSAAEKKKQNKKKDAVSAAEELRH